MYDNPKHIVHHTSTRTVRLLLDLDSTQSETLVSLAQDTCAVRNRISELNQELRLTNAVKLHHLVYYQIRSEFPTMLADYVCMNIRSVAGAYASLHTRAKTLTRQIEWRAKNNYRSRPSIIKQRDVLTVKTPIFNTRHIPIPYKYWRISPADRLLSISVRVNYSKLKIAIASNEYNLRQLATISDMKSHQAIQLVRDKKNRWFAHIPVTSTIPLCKGQYDDAVGIDLGMTDLVSSTLGILSDKQEVDRIDAIYRKYQLHSSRLQSNGSRSAKRRLKKTSGRRRRLMMDLLHRISKHVVHTIASSGATHVVMERLTGIRDSAVKRSDKRRLARWCYAQLQSHIEYKAILKNITVTYVPSAHTSTRCSNCGSSDTHRDGKMFLCRSCTEYIRDADVNASYNIRARFFELVEYRNLVVL